jgi:hypothetical protein
VIDLNDKIKTLKDAKLEVEMVKIKLEEIRCKLKVDIENLKKKQEDGQ